MRLLPLLILLVACAPTRSGEGTGGTPPDDLPSLTYGWSFGNCWGQCRGTLWVQDTGDVTFELTGWEEEVYSTVTGTAHDDTMDELADAYDAIARASLQATYGCPDCADGGAEFVRFDDDVDPDESTFEFGSPPAELAEIQGLLRALAVAMEGCLDGDGYDQETCEVGENTVDPEPVPPG